MAQKLIIYHCYGGAHSSVVAAAIHLNKLDKRIPQLKNCFLFHFSTVKQRTGAAG